MRKLLMLIMMLAISIMAAAQNKQDIEKTRTDILANKKQIVKATLDLNKQEADVFWPLYEEYQNALRLVHDRSSRLIANYLMDYKTLTDDQAEVLIREVLNIEREQLNLKETYVKKFSAVLPPKKLARYFQLENKMQTVLDYDLAKKIPIVR